MMLKLRKKSIIENNFPGLGCLDSSNKATILVVTFLLISIFGIKKKLKKKSFPKNVIHSSINFLSFFR